MQGNKAKWAWILGVPVAILVGMMFYGSTIPEYRIQAREVRVACEDLAKIGRTDPSTCRTVYDKMIAKGKAAEADAAAKKDEWAQKLRDNEKMLQGIKDSKSES